ncbi:hypothetical protein OHZ10_22810 [Burkholderia arboris]|uniref:Uncharacterized protein n=1 Tax=Burkholderia arboris TaxID=488730 RepID=A0ABZ3DUS0_9BURK
MSEKSVPKRQCTDEFKIETATLAESVGQHEAAWFGLRARDIVGFPFTQLTANLSPAIFLLWTCARTLTHAIVRRELRAARANWIGFP